MGSAPVLDGEVRVGEEGGFGKGSFGSGGGGEERE